MLNSFLALVVSGRVDQLGMIATLASSRSRVQIPSRPPSVNPVVSNERIFQVVWRLKTEGYAERTLAGFSKRLKFLAKRVGDLDNPDVVKGFISAQRGWGNAYKETMVNAYNHFVNAFDLSWKKPIYKRSERLPTVPSTEQVNMIIAHAGRKYALIFSFLRDTGLRPIELHRLTLRNLDLEKGLVYPVTAKSGSARVLRLKASTLSMLKEYVSRSEFRLDERMFPSTDVVSHVFMRVRNRLSERLHEPELRRIRLYDLRHYFATRLYQKTKDILFVKRQLGHKRIENTLIYTHLVDFASEEYISKVAESVKEVCELVEAGFEYVTEMDGKKVFRKPK